MLVVGDLRRFLSNVNSVNSRRKFNGKREKKERQRRLSRIG